MLNRISALKNLFLKLPLLLKVISLILVLGASWFVWGKITGKKSSSPQYQTAKVEKGTLIVSVSASGQVASVNSAGITTSASGVVSNVLVKDGQEVKMGQVIAEIYLDQVGLQKYTQALSSYKSAQSNLDSAKANLYSSQSKEFAANVKFMNDAVARDLATTDPTYIQENADWLAAEASYKIQEKAILIAQTSLSSAYYSLKQSSPIIYAPISGKITGLSLQTGTVIATDNTSAIASVKTAANPMVSINLTQIDVPKIKIGNKVTITLDAFPDKTFTGVVISVDTVGQTSSGVTSYPTVIKLDSPNEDIYSNMSAEASIITNVKDNVLLISSSAIQTQDGSNFLRVLRNGEVQEVNVEIGLSSDTETEIKSGVSEGDEIVISTISTTKSSTQTSSPFSMFGTQRNSNQMRFVTR